MNLILTVLFTSWLLICFRFFDRFKIDNLQAIIINYFTCAIIGLSINFKSLRSNELSTIEPWMVLALITGACFLPTFFLMSITVKRISITVSTIASKISLIIPVSVSLLFLNPTSTFTLQNGIGLIIGFSAILLSSIRTKNSLTPVGKRKKIDYLLPILVFLGGGLVDVLINVTNYQYLPVSKSEFFPTFAFGAAATIGLFVLLYKTIILGDKIEVKNIYGGIALGIPNYLSIFFLLKTLKDFDNNGAIVFPLTNILIILLSTLIATLFLNEKLNKYNYIGLILSLISLVLLIGI